MPLAARLWGAMAVGAIGPHRRLPAEEGARGHPQRLQRQGQQADRDLLAGRHHHVVLGAIVMRPADLAHPVGQLIGRRRPSRRPPRRRCRPPRGRAGCARPRRGSDPDRRPRCRQTSVPPAPRRRLRLPGPPRRCPADPGLSMARVYIFGRARASKFAYRFVGAEGVTIGADAAELERFADLAAHWWDEAGPLAPLHKLNPVRLGYIRDRICAHLGRDPLAERPLAGLAVPRRRLRRRPACASRSRASAPRSPASIPRRGASRRPSATRARPNSRSTTGSPPRQELVAESETVRSGLRDGGGRARRRPGGFSPDLRCPGPPGRRPGSGHPQSHLSRLRARHRRRRVCARLAAARHPQLVAFRAPVGGGARPFVVVACAPWT